ncbi:MAG: pyridoxal-phosphate dependent enzyme, partial [Chloroflexota bacterium]
PASYFKARRTIELTDGVVEAVSDQEILDAKAMVDAAGIGCEPASAASVAGVRKLIAKGVIGADEDVVAVLTGHVLKDPEIIMGYHQGALDSVQSNFANALRAIDPTLEAVESLLQQ